MLKKILIIALILNTPFVLPFDSSATAFATDRYSGAGICGVVGVICTWLAYKDFKKWWQACEDANHHLKILKEMGIKVLKVSKTEWKWDYVEMKEYYTIDIPSNFSQQEKEKAQEHSSLFLANMKYVNNQRVWPAIGSLILIPTAICALVFNKN